MTDTDNNHDLSAPPGTSSKAGQETSTIATEAMDSDSATDIPTAASDETNDCDLDNDENNGQGGEDVEAAADVAADAAATGDANDEANDDTKTQEEKDQEAKAKEEEEIKYKNWPLHNIAEPHAHDVLYGRGGGTNHHPGNKRYRQMVEGRKHDYLYSKRLEKPVIAFDIIKKWRDQTPLGRFLKQDQETGLWNDVGDKRAREKTSQALREKAPDIRKQLEKGQNGPAAKPKKKGKPKRGSNENDVSVSDSDEDRKPAAKPSKVGKPKRGMLKREHTLGTTLVDPGEEFDLEGFVWSRENSRNLSAGSTRSSGQGIVLPPTMSNSSGSAAMPLPHDYYPPQPHPAAPDFHGRVSTEEQRRELSNNSIESWDHHRNPHAHYPPPLSSQRAGFQNFPDQPDFANYQRPSDWARWDEGRSHSLSGYPLPGANVNEPVEDWSRPHPSRGTYDPVRFQSGGSIGSVGATGQPPQGHYRQVPSPSHSVQSNSSYNMVDNGKSWSPDGGERPHPRHFPYSQFDGQHQAGGRADSSAWRDLEHNGHSHAIPRPGMVKRDTSNQNENCESKPNQVKRATLNRDQSATSNRLKEQFIPEVFTRDMRSLQETTEQIQLNSPVSERPSAPIDLSNGDGATLHHMMPLPADGHATRADTWSNNLSHAHERPDDDNTFNPPSPGNIFNPPPRAPPPSPPPPPNPEHWNGEGRLSSADLNEFAAEFMDGMDSDIFER
eukprot:jgi/Psemu1/63352/estExt_Genemark1.C_230102